ncbi:Nif3-like dinuclear metal center hexameric protein [Phaeocystidibacter luteus]|uniref:GTP cyclohydrolase 1 type 2 homolog n=1 Tax=Phaeocystidibacter luteus TaxID=911197 RepID=A0A6N6RJW4_9FLAO|nr:Nif3-like dinuclear metal center hexameric protein [Phaeocystidibacter luteus]KAB2808098.1 Nif3-like dinuclear metal center hexameric protein [Phaeocystidibacter luteus]
MRIADIISHLEGIAPNAYQESYDNSGLLVGNANDECTGVVVSLDATEAVIEEAVAKGANLVVSHHPIIFSGLKRLNGKNYIERTVMLAIVKGVALYAIHTNLDNVDTGVNAKLAEVLGLQNTRILSPKKGWIRKLVTFVPKSHIDEVMSALFAAGAGNIGTYDECSFRNDGTGTFRGGEGSDPFVGVPGQRHEEEEFRLEVLYPFDRQSKVLNALFASHPYEEVAYDLISLENSRAETGSGMIGELESEMTTLEFLKYLKEKVGGVVRYTKPIGEKVKNIAICGGSGSFLLNDAIRQKADVFVTGDFKYHQFFDADDRIVIADIGHFESEQFTIELLYDAIREKFPTFATFKTAVKTNPILYL